MHADDFLCPACAARAASAVDSYKHHWLSCDRCGTVVRDRKPRYLFDREPLSTIVQNTVLNRVYGNTLFARKEIIEQETRMYDRYRMDVQRGVAGTKWEPMIADVRRNLTRYGMDISGKSVLDISGGPGFLTQELARSAKRAVVTEFSEHAVRAMHDGLGLEAVRFDYNSDDIRDCVQGEFDLVLLLYSIGFCDDLRAFVQSLRGLLHPKSLVYIAHSPPTLGLMMRWQFEEYVYTRCWPTEFVAQCFREIGMRELAHEDEGSYAFDERWFDTAKNPVARTLQGAHRSIGRHYLRRALREHRSIDARLVQRNVRQVFALDA